ncbi:MAG: LysR substrate-binding domain-containing protein [Pseudomonadota bacterium]
MDQLRALRVFTQVIAEGSFAGAARVLDLAPAVVTRAVSDLEDHLGARLLNRTTRKLALTEVGEDYLERARRILGELDDADAVASALNKAPGGSLRILCPPAFATHQLVPQLPLFRHRFPNIQLELAASGPVESVNENFDVSILSIGQQALQGDFVVRPLAASTFIVCAAPAYLARCGEPQQPDDLHQHDGLLPDVAAVRRELTLFRVARGVHSAPRRMLRVGLRAPAIATGQLEVLYAAALAGMGVAGLPTFMVAEAMRDGRLVRVLSEWHGGSLQLYAAMPTRKHVPARTRAFLDFLVETFGGNQDDPWLAAIQP